MSERVWVGQVRVGRECQLGAADEGRQQKTHLVGYSVAAVTTKETRDGVATSSLQTRGSQLNRSAQASAHKVEVELTLESYCLTAPVISVEGKLLASAVKVVKALQKLTDVRLLGKDVG